ncbi:MAG: DUF5615 family PIN-like protein [Acidobacteria bacterium]|nr:DUF5615 family PIN-like protein [Acidobacteriota bacterium]
MRQALELRLLLDQGIPADSVALLRRIGYGCDHVAPLGLAAASDEEILALAAATDSVVITLDADFHALIAVRGLRRPSVIRIRREGCKAELVAAIVESVVDRFAGELSRGCLVSVNERRATCHLLPIG